MTDNNTDKPVWLIAGCSTGLGRALAQHIMDRGLRLVATACDKAKIIELAGGAEDRVLALDLDVIWVDQVAAADAATEERYGRVDVLVNNADYG
jgi:NADP-dependent 3-hydroxy acid dehydrogenase YdfG